MRFGIASIFAFRPHVEHMAYLAELLRQGGHEVSGFTCDAAVEHCWSRDLRGRSKLRQCPTCVVGGIRSYPVPRVWSISRRYNEPLEPERFRRLTLSSVTTIHRTETAEDMSTPEFRTHLDALERPVGTVYANAKRWIAEEDLDAVLFFNGRMDLTAGLRAACEDMSRPFVTVDRAWFGHGLTLVPNEACIALGEINRLSKEFRNRPLLPDQAAYAGRIAADRFCQRNVLEWRLYNVGAERVAWPNAAKAGDRVLILPSSRNEFEGHPDFDCGWQDYTSGIKDVLDCLAIAPRNAVLRCHPNWAEPIGRNTGWRSERHWVSWAEQLGVTVIRGAERCDTYGLIEEADYVLVNGSSAGVEAGLRGRRVICVGHSTYEEAGFAPHLNSTDDLPSLDALAEHDPERIARQALRYIYTHGRRFVQFVAYVRAITTLRYEYYEGADPARLVRLCQSGRLEPDDGRYGEDPTAEDGIVRAVLEGDWQALERWSEPAPATPRMQVRRRAALRWIDDWRGLFARGDL